MVKEVHQEVQVTLLQTTQSDIAHVYWIRRPEHTDIFTQGYIGVTTEQPRDRFNKHIRISNSSSKVKKSVVHKAIKSIGVDNLCFDIVLISDKDYCYDVENKLRDNQCIGWNVAIGGRIPSSLLGRKHSEDTKRKMSFSQRGKKRSAHHISRISESKLGIPRSQDVKDKLSAKAKGRKHSTETKRRLSEIGKGRVPSPESAIKRKATLQSKRPWNTKQAKRAIWGLSDEFYILFNKGYHYRSASKHYPELCSEYSLLSMWKHFKNGWIPNQDEKWLSDFNKQEGI
jgi:hypothetical protein